MNFEDYQILTTRTFKEHKPLSAHDARLLDWTIGLSGEVGEVSEIIKHAVFHGEEIDKMELAKEIGDVLWYVGAISETVGIPLELIAELNLTKLQHRHKGTYSDATSETRHQSEKRLEDTAGYKLLQRRIRGEEV